jgi:hypothetical protein
VQRPIPNAKHQHSTFEWYQRVQLAVAKHYHVHQVVDKKKENYGGKYRALNNSFDNRGQTRKLIANTKTLKSIA